MPATRVHAPVACDPRACRAHIERMQLPMSSAAQDTADLMHTCSSNSNRPANESGTMQPVLIGAARSETAFVTLESLRGWVAALALGAACSALKEGLLAGRGSLEVSVRCASAMWFLVKVTCVMCNA